MSCAKTRHSSVSAATFTWTMSLCRRASSSTNAPRRPKPALLTSVSTSTPSARSVAWIAAAAPGEARSETSTRTCTPWAATSSRASSSSRSRERATSTRSRPLRAKTRARSAPIPLDAPVTRMDEDPATVRVQPCPEDRGYVCGSWKMEWLHAQCAREHVAERQDRDRQREGDEELRAEHLDGMARVLVMTSTLHYVRMGMRLVRHPAVGIVSIHYNPKETPRYLSTSSP